VLVRSAGRLLATLRFAEEVRGDAAASIAELRDGLGVEVGVLSGDSAAPALRGLADGGVEVATGLLPDDKLRRVAAATARARREGGAVGFVGDGVNDAPALAAADVGIAFGEPADLPRVTADALCLSDELRAIPWLLRHARHSVRIVRQNLALAFGYNSIAVGLAAAGRLDPLVAAAAMLGSSVLVIANARRVAPRWEPGTGNRERSPGQAGAASSTPAADQASWMPSSSSLR
jgi:P-type Cu2+ transporter